MPGLTYPTRPKPPRLNKRRQIPQQDSQTTLRDGIDEEPYLEELPMDVDFAPPLPTKYDQPFEDKTLPITPIDPPQTDYYDDDPEPMEPYSEPYSPPPAATYTVPTKKNRNDKPSTSQRWKTAVGKMFSLKKPKQNTTMREYHPPPPLSPASSRLPSVYGQPYSSKNTQPYRSAVTLLPASSSTRHGPDYYDDDEVTNIGLSRMPSPITPITARGGISPMDHFEPITSVMRRADWPTSPITPVPHSARPPSPVRQRRSSEANPSTLRRDSSSRRAPSTRSRPSIPSSSRTPSPPPEWPNRSTSRLYITNPSPVPTPSPPPMIVKHPSIEIMRPSPPGSVTTLSRSQTLHTTRTKESIPPVISINKPKKAGPRILQAHLPTPVAPDPKHHVFTGPWYNRRGDEWLGISATPGEYRSRKATDDLAFSPKFLKFPEKEHHFMNPMGDVMNAQTLQMISKAPRL